MTSPQRIRVLTPEALDAAAANLVNTANSRLRTAVSQYAGTATQASTSGVSTATPNAVISRDANARAQVADPVATGDISTKNYVDTKVSAYVTAQAGVASGLATLDGNGLVTTSQIPTTLGRYLGSGTSWPSGARAGDRFTHSGVGCMYTFDGINWWQATPCSVNSRAARDALLANYGGYLHAGFLVRQYNKGYLWRQNAGAWTYAGWAPDTGSTINGDMVQPYAVQGDVYGRYADTSPSIKLRAVNLSIGSGGNTTSIPWTVETIDATHGNTREWLDMSTPTAPKLLDRCAVEIQMYAVSDAGNAGVSQLTLNNPGAANVMPTGGVVNQAQRSVGYAGAGNIYQPLNWHGYVNAGDTFAAAIYQSNTGNGAINYSVYANLSIFPA